MSNDLSTEKQDLSIAQKDLDVAKSALSWHSIALCKGSSLIVDDKHGIRPMLDYIVQNVDLSRYSVADIVVGKAVATLFVYSKISAVYARVLSKSALDYLVNHEIYVEYDTIVDNISNRAGDGICPMELCVADIDDAKEAYIALKNKVEQMQMHK